MTCLPAPSRKSRNGVPRRSASSRALSSAGVERCGPVSAGAPGRSPALELGRRRRRRGQGVELGAAISRRRARAGPGHAAGRELPSERVPSGLAGICCRGPREPAFDLLGRPSRVAQALARSTRPAAPATGRVRRRAAAAAPAAASGRGADARRARARTRPALVPLARLLSARATTSSKACGARAHAAPSGGGSERCAQSLLSAASSGNATCPVRAKKSTQPSA